MNLDLPWPQPARPERNHRLPASTHGLCSKLLRLLKKHAGVGGWYPPALTPARQIQPIHLKANHFREIGFVWSKSEPSNGRAQFRTTAHNRAQPIAGAGPHPNCPPPSPRRSATIYRPHDGFTSRPKYLNRRKSKRPIVHSPAPGPRPKSASALDQTAPANYTRAYPMHSTVAPPGPCL